MNNSLIKFLGIFLIFLFCFSPLGAIDLDQGDNSTQINDKDNNSAQIIDNSTDFKDLNGTVIADDDSSHDDDNDMEIKSDNGTDDKKAIDYDVEIQNVSVNGSNSSKNLQKINPQVSITAEDSVYGEGTIVKITVGSKEFGIIYDQKAVLSHEDTREEEPVWITRIMQGTNEIKLREDLPPGHYNIRYNFRTYSDYFYDVIVNTDFTVHKRDPAINCSIKDIGYGEKPVLNVYKGDSFDAEVDYVYVSSPQFSQKYKIQVTGKPISFELDEDLPAGRYTCDVVYPGDSIHNSQNTSVTFDVKKLDPNLTVDAKDSILQGENLDVEIRANKAVNADVTCKLGRDFQKVHLVNGVGHATINCRNLALGNYKLCAYMDGDDIFNPGIDFADFKVVENTKLNIRVDSVYFYDKLKVEVFANKAMTGIVQVQLNNSDGIYDLSDKVYDVEVENGYGSFEITSYMPPGNYTASAYYEGDGVYPESKAVTKFEVKYHVPDLRVNVNNIKVGDNAKVEVSASSNLTDFTDSVQVQLNNSDKVYDVLVRNGYGKVDVSGLAPGNYTANAYFKGDGVFTPKNASTSFSVLPRDPDLKISVSNITIGNTAKLEVSANKSLNGNVKVQLNNSDKVYDVEVKDGAGSVLISGLVPGNYTASAYFAGSDYFLEANATTEFALDPRTQT